MRELIARLLDWMRRDELDRELAEELRFHQQQLERDASAGRARGDDARFAARRRLGSPLRAREAACDRWSIPSLDHLQQDVRYALRGLRRSPAYTATVAITLALGIGANAAMFGVVDRLMFRPLTYLRDPSTVHRLYLQSSDRGEPRTRTSSEYARYLDFRKWTSSFAQLAAFSERPLAVGSAELARERRVGAVSASFFTFFDARPALGRFFTEDEDRTPRGADVAVLSYAFWKTEFGGRNVLGEFLQVGNIRARIIGVAPRGFAGVNDALPPVVYVPITTYAASTGTNDAKTYYSEYSWGWLNMLARRKPDVTVTRAELDATQAYRRSWDVQAAVEPILPPSAVAKPRVIVSAVRLGAGPNPALEARTALWVTAVAAIVLLIACANVANLSLARALRRQRETAVRLALGVSRGRLVRQWIAESAILAMVGSGLGLLIAQWGGAAIRRQVESAEEIATVLLMDAGRSSHDVLGDWRTLGVTVGIALATACLTGFAPALLSLRGDLAPTLRAGAKGVVGHGGRLRSVLLVLQGALSVTLLVGAALFVRSLEAVRSTPMGYDADHVLIVRRNIIGQRPIDSAFVALRNRLMAAARGLPGVEAVAWASSAPFISTSSTGLYVPGVDSVSKFGQFSYQATTADYFRVMGTRILRGRGLSAADRAGAPRVAVVSESMARVLWPGRDALGQCMHVWADTLPCTTVVGIAEDMVQRDFAAGKRYHYYLPIEQFTRTQGWGLLLRLRGEPAVEAEQIRRALQREIPGNAAYITTQPLAEIVGAQQRSWRLGASMFSAFGLLALLVAAVGLYGVIGYDVTQRMHELGIRVALGAQRSTILRLVLGRALRVALVGVVAGTLMALAASKWLQPLLFQQSARDPRVYGFVGATMLLVAFIASALPAQRAAGADPNAVLRSE
jgi:predicted permease